MEDYQRTQRLAILIFVLAMVLALAFSVIVKADTRENVVSTLDGTEKIEVITDEDFQNYVMRYLSGISDNQIKKEVYQDFLDKLDIINASISANTVSQNVIISVNGISMNSISKCSVSGNVSVNGLSSQFDKVVDEMQIQRDILIVLCLLQSINIGQSIAGKVIGNLK